MPPNLEQVVAVVALEAKKQFGKDLLRGMQIETTIRFFVVRLLNGSVTSHTVESLQRAAWNSTKGFLSRVQTDKKQAQIDLEEGGSDVDHVPLDHRPSKKPFSIVDMSPGRLDPPEQKQQRRPIRSVS